MATAPHSGWFHSRPKGVLRLALRLPIALYRLHLGWLLDHRFLLLTHRGRRTGQVHQTVLEVVRYDPRTGSCTVAAGWGERAAWYRNIQAQPALQVTVGHHHFLPSQRFLTDAESEATLRHYARRHRVAAHLGVRFLHLPIDQGRPLPMVVFRPTPVEASTD